MKKVLAFLLIANIILIFGCEKEQKVAEVKKVPVRVYAVQPDSIASYLEITGSILAGNDATVYSKVSEQLNKIEKHVGSRVQKDEVIAVLEHAISQQGVNQAKAALQSAKARYEQVKQDYQRYQRLYNQNAVSQQQWDQTRSSMQEVEGALEQAQAAYQQAKEQLENAYIKAPFDGVVGSFYYDTGQMVPAGQPVAKIVNTNLMKAKLNIPDIYVRDIKMNQKVLASLPSMPDRQFPGRINRIDPAIDPLSRTFQVEVVFSNEGENLKSGMYGRFRIQIARHTGTFVLPDNSLLHRTDVTIDPETGETHTQRRQYVFVAAQDTARLVEVQTGLEYNGRIEITNGLQEESQVIIRGQKIVKEGQPVEIKTAQQPQD